MERAVQDRVSLVGSAGNRDLDSPDALPPHMLKLYSFIGATIGGYAGWYAGAPVGFMTAFMLSMVGTGIGMYYGRKIAKHYGM